MSEVGNAKNVANCGEVVLICTSYGTLYNPTNPELTVANLGLVETQVRVAHRAVEDSRTDETNTRNARATLFEGLEPLVTRIGGALKSTQGVPQKTVANFASINRKIRGQRAAKPQPVPDPNNPNPVVVKTISVAQLSYDVVLDHFNNMIDLLQSVPNYNPNEVELKVTSLQTLHTAMSTANKNVVTAEANTKKLMITRDEIMVTMIGLMDKVKAYVKSLFGAGSPQLKQLTDLKFSRPRKKK